MCVGQQKDDRTLTCMVFLKDDSFSSLNLQCFFFQVTEHNYAVLDTPKTLKRKLDACTDSAATAKRKLKLSLERERRLRRKVNTFSEILDDLKQKQLVSEDASAMLERCFTGIPLEVTQRLLKKTSSEGDKSFSKLSREKYSPALRMFALTLQFYSTKAYNYVRETFDFTLPHPSTITKWYSSINGEPGFTGEAMNAIRAKASEAQMNNKELLCNLVVDEMAIRKHLEWDGKKFRGYVDIGNEVDDDSNAVASEALVFMLVSLDSHWKVPCGYFLINGLSGKERANIVKLCLTKLHEAGVHVTSLTCDGLRCNFTMFKDLGASVGDASAMSTSFPHPVTQEKVYCLLDACHMLKLVRNALSSLGCLKDGSGASVSWHYIVQLQELQEKEGLHAATKLRAAHIQWQKQKMKVNLAAQTLSTSVADAIEFCREDIKLPQFKGSEGTVKFIRMFDKLFDFLNSRNPVAKGFKAPLRRCNKGTWINFFEEAKQYISGMTDASGTPIFRTPRKTPFLGFLVTIESVIGLATTLLLADAAPLRYFLTYKLSQDHIELFFAAVRAKGGWNNNPTVSQFVAAYKRLVTHNQIKGGQGNCTSLDTTRILYVSSQFCTNDELDMATAKRNGTEDLVQGVDLPDESELDAVVEDLPALSPYLGNVVGYIAGFVCRMVKRRIPCSVCYSAVTAETSGSALLNRKNRGGLAMPSSSTTFICQLTEKSIRLQEKLHGGGLPKKTAADTVTARVMTELSGVLRANKVYPELHDHMFESAVESNHFVRLVKCVIGCYVKIRMHHAAKQATAKITGPNIRKRLAKLIIFNHQ